MSGERTALARYLLRYAARHDVTIERNRDALNITDPRGKFDSTARRLLDELKPEVLEELKDSARAMSYAAWLRTLDREAFIDTTPAWAAVKKTEPVVQGIVKPAAPCPRCAGLTFAYLVSGVYRCVKCDKPQRSHVRETVTIQRPSADREAAA